MNYFLLLMMLGFTAFAENSLQFADRYYITSTLGELFGPESKTILTENILKNGQLFGGPCDVYEQVRVGENKYANKEFSRCFSGKHEFDFPMRVQPSLLRESWMIKACTALVQNKKTFGYFEKSYMSGFKPTVEKIYELQQAFDPNAKLNKPLNEFYIHKMDSTKADKKLKMLVLELCTYPSWQLI